MHYVKRMKIVYHEKHLCVARDVKSIDLRRAGGSYSKAMEQLGELLRTGGRVFMPIGEGPLDEAAAEWIFNRVEIVSGKLVAKGNQYEMLLPLIAKERLRG